MTQNQSSSGRVSRRIDDVARRGLVNGNGLTNGLGLSNGNIGRNGLVNGLGKVNGNGMTNGLTNGLTNGMRGNGLVNGRGLINGTRTPLRSNLFGVVTHKDLRIGMSLAVLFVLLLPSFYLIMSIPPPPTPPIEIDGAFGDWAGVPVYDEDVGGQNANITFTEYGSVQDSETLFMLCRVAGTLFSEPRGYDGFYAFIDADGDLTTGYWQGTLGAEYGAFISGGAGRISSAMLKSFDFAGDQLNWSAWDDVQSISAAFSGKSMEFAVPIDNMDISEDYAVRLVSTDFDGHFVLASLRFGREFAALRVEQVPQPNSLVITPGEDTILRLRLKAYGRTVEVPFRNKVHWQSHPSQLEGNLQMPNEVNVKAGEELMVNVSVPPVGFAEGTPLWLNLTGVDVDVPVTVNVAGAVAYVSRGPQQKAVDGWFGDWQTGLHSDQSPPLANPNVDVRTYASNVTRVGGGGQALFYVDFRGSALGGSPVPMEARWAEYAPPQPPGPVKPLMRVAGEDILRFFIDANESDAKGCQVDGILADHRLEIKGHAGRVESGALYDCIGGSWILSTSAKSLAMASGSKIEAGIDLALLGQLESPNMLVESTDWSNLGDLPPLTRLESRSGRGERTRGTETPTLMSDPPGVDQVTSLPLSLDPTLDGRCDELAYYGAGHATNASFEFYVGHRNSMVWVCVIVEDSTDDVRDYAELMLDTMHDGGTAPQTDDRRFNMTRGSSLVTRQRGDGTTWIDCDIVCSPGDAAVTSFYNGRETYEFRLNQDNVWNTNNPSGRAGFAIHMFDNETQQDYYWGSYTVDRNNPDTWGHLDIPEFTIWLLPVLISLALPRLGRRRRRA